MGLVAAVMIHAAVFLLFRAEIPIPSSPFGAAGPPMGDLQAAAGGSGGMQAISFRVQQSRPEPEVPVPAPVVETPEIREPETEEIEIEMELPDVTLALAGTSDVGMGGEQGTSTGPGLTDGAGEGGGGSSEEGGSGIVAPVPRGMILPPSDRPRSVRGREVTVWVFVNARGRVLPDSIRLEPPTPDEGYNRRLKRSAAEWIFEPARRAGRAIAAWYPYQIIL